MKPCGLCKRAIEQAPSLTGTNAHETGFMFILHKPDSRITGTLFDEESSYSLVLNSSTTGKELARILNHCDLTLDDILLTNFFKCTLPEDKTPYIEEYRNCVQRLKQQIQEFHTKKIVLFSKFMQKYFPKTKAPQLFMPHPSAIWAIRNTEKRQAKYEEVRSFLYS